MDKRQEKTLHNIHHAFSELVNKKDYDEITIQDILEEASISRSTFYSHFKTKDDLLLSVSNHIFEHVFSKTLQEEKTHDFSKDTFFDYKHLIIHIFYHVQDEKELFVGIFKSKGIDIFLNEFKKHLYRFVNSYFNNYPAKEEIPLSLRKDIAVEDFIVILKYWIKNNFHESPEQIGEYYFVNFIK